MALNMAGEIPLSGGRSSDRMGISSNIPTFNRTRLLEEEKTNPHI